MSYAGNKSGKAKKPKSKRVARVRSMWATPQAGILLAPKLLSKLRYSATVSQSSGVAMSSIYQFILNGPFDVDATGVGTQPPGYDNLSGMYNCCRVLWATYKVTPFYKTGSNQLLSVWTSTNASSPVDFQSATNQPDARVLAVPFQGDCDRVKRYISMAKGFGVEPAEIETDSDYGQASTAVLPTKRLYLNLISSQTSGTASSTLDAFVEIKMGVEWYNPITGNMN